jgi:hypothetical protein
MPNWCYTEFYVFGSTEDIARFREYVRGRDGDKEIEFDFNRLIPMPSALRDTVSDCGAAYQFYYGDAQQILEYAWIKNLDIETVEQLRDHFDADPKHKAIADEWKANIARYGAPTWYEWSCEQWGTKWNACDAEVTENRDGSLNVHFDTAWTFPFPIFEKMVAEFPMLVFEGSAEEPNMEIFISFEGNNGEFVWEDDEEARAKAAAAYAEEDESTEVAA